MSTITKPTWADDKTTSELIDGDNNPVYTRRLEASAALLRSGDSEIGTITGEPYTLGFELTHHANTGTALESDELPVSWLILKDPAAARAIADGLLAAADEWERLVGGVR